MISTDLAPLAADVDSLHQLPGNPRKGDVAAVARSLETFGQRKPIVARRDGTIIAGNHTWAAARELGWDQIAVVWVDDDDSTAQAFALADNRTAELGSYDEGLLAALVAEVHGVDPDLLDATGWSGTDLQRLLDQAVEMAPLVNDPDDVPDVPSDPRSVLGDVWLLGPHRVTCGDSTDPLAVERVLDGRLADCMWTDPPYGVNYVGKTADALTIQNDGAADLPTLLHGFLAAATGALKPGSPAYVAHPAGPLQLQFGQAIIDAGWSLRQQLVWVKDTFALGRSDYHYSHEPIWLAYTPGGEGRRGRGGDSWFGDNAQRSTLEYPKPKRSELHPTMKPVALVEHMVRNSTPPPGRCVRTVRRLGIHVVGRSFVWACGPRYRVGSAVCGRDLPPLAAGHEHVSRVGSHGRTGRFRGGTVSRRKAPEPARPLGKAGQEFWDAAWVKGAWLKPVDVELLQMVCEQMDERVALRVRVLQGTEPRRELRDLDKLIIQGLHMLGFTPAERAASQQLDHQSSWA